MEFRHPHLRCSLGRVHLNFRGCEAHLPSYVWQGETMQILLEEEDQVKLKYLITTMIASRSSRKSTYAIWWEILMKAMEIDWTSLLRYSWLIGCRNTCFYRTRGWANFLCLPSSNLGREGNKLTLAPLYLGSLYALLDEYARNITRVTGRYDMVMQLDSSSLRVFIWERFPLISPKATEFPAGVMEEVTPADGSNKMKPFRMEVVKPEATC